MKAAFVTLLLAQASFSTQAAPAQHYTVYLDRHPLVQNLYASVQESFEALDALRQQQSELLNAAWLKELEHRSREHKDDIEPAMEAGT